MFGKGTRRDFLSRSGALAGAGLLATAPPPQAKAATGKGPHDFVIVEGHRDMWELSGRTRLPEAGQHLPITNFLGPRLIEGGVSVVIAPAGGGDSLDERDGTQAMLEGDLRVLDLYLTDIEHSKDKVSIIRTKADIPTQPNVGKVQFFIDMEGGGGLQTNMPEPEFPAERSMALLRQFFRLGVRGIQLTHNGRNQLGDGRAIDKGSRLTPFGVSVVGEMNRLGMMVGVSHLSTEGIMHAAEISKTPIVSTHQNLQRFVKSRPLVVEITDEEAKVIAQTGGIVGIRYIGSSTPYKLLVDEVEYLSKLIGPEHIGVGWLGHDKANPNTREVEGHLSRTYSGVEAETQYTHWDNFIKMLSERGLTDEQIGMILGGNYLRIWKRILPEA